MVDPIDSLPFETIVQLFSLLSTPQIAISTATSRSWRQAILTDPVINRIIDFTAVRLDEDQTIELVKRLVSVSTHPDKLIGKEIHIDLDNFCFRFEDYIEKTSGYWDGSFNEEEDLKVATSKYLELIHAISDATQGKLSKLFLEINHRDIDGFTLQFSELICQSLQLIAKPKEGLQTEVRFSISFPMAMESGGIDSRRFSIVSEVYEGYNDEDVIYDSESCKKLLREVYSFTGVGLKKSGLNLKTFSDLVAVAGVFVIEPYYLLFEEILRSRGTIEELGITFNGDPSINLIYDLVNSLSNLSSLTLLNLFARTAVPVLRSRPSFKLKKLQIDYTTHLM